MVGKSAFSLQRGQFDPKFQVEGVTPIYNSSSHKTRLNDLSSGIRMWAKLSFVLSQIMHLTDGDRQTDRQTDGWMDGRTDGRTDRQTDRQTRQTDRRTDERTDRQTHRRTDGQTDRETDERTDTFLVASPCWHFMQCGKKV